MNPRPVEELLESSLYVIDCAFELGAQWMFPLLSGGHDSLSAVFVASQHPRFLGEVHHIDTGIGSKATREFVHDVCVEYGWRLTVYKSKATYERFVTRLGFPGPGTHQWVYNWLKDRCIAQMTRGLFSPVALITGCRSQESTRRMGHVEAIKVGELSKGRVVKRSRIWTAPCSSWTTEEQRLFMDHHDLPRNPIKSSPIGMSGECFCGAFARPNEIEMIRRYCPDVAREIERLAQLAKANGKHSIWGTRPERKKGIVQVETGPLCSSCDIRASAAGIIFKNQ